MEGEIDEEEFEEEDPEPRFISDFEKVNKKFNKLKCQCDEAQRLINEYLIARDVFDKLKHKFETYKL